jgi:hypothetical protein
LKPTDTHTHKINKKECPKEALFISRQGSEDTKELRPEVLTTMLFVKKMFKYERSVLLVY